MKPKKILIAVDGSEHSMRAVESSFEYSKLVNTEVVLVHCHKRFPRLLGEPYLQDAVTEIKDEAEQTMETFRKALKKEDIEFTERILEGPPGSVIPNIAKIENCDLIIMGSRGLTDLEGLFVGSVTHRVLHLAHCPVLVTK